MRNFYEDLGVTATASVEEIKRAYRKKALQHHPDKSPGGSDEVFKRLNSAYSVLSDPTKRSQFDQLLDVFSQSAGDDVRDFHTETSAGDYEQITGDSIAFSEKFKQEHASLCHHFSQKPLATASVKKFFKKPSSPKKTSMSVELKNKTLTLADMAGILRSFLEQQYSPTQITQVKELVQSQAKQIKSHELNFLLIIQRFLTSEQSTWLALFKDITTFACSLNPLPNPLIDLFESEMYRYHVTIAVINNWVEKDDTLTVDVLQACDGNTAVKDSLKRLNEQFLELSEDSKNYLPLKRTIRAYSILLRFEKDFFPSLSGDLTADELRQLGFRVLDWLPAFLRLLPSEVIINMFTYAANCLQLASKLEPIPAVQMADEKIAQDLYVTGCALAFRINPCLETRTILRGLGFISEFKYVNDTSEVVIAAFSHRAQWLLNTFPFPLDYLSSHCYVCTSDPFLSLFRQHLASLVGRLESTESKELSLVPAPTIFYHAYEACLKEWYQDEINVDLEESMRLKLMQSLLNQFDWNFEDVEDNLTFLKTTVSRDEQGWIKSDDLLSCSSVTPSEVYTSLDGLRINYQTGQLELLLTPCDQNTPDCLRVISINDVRELINHNICAAIFSLDAVDPDMPYHPFNTMRFSPPRIRNTGFFETLLAADYLLKFLTLGQEVRGVYPFDAKSIQSITDTLPEYLKCIFDNFHANQSGDSIHRFWIEVDSALVATNTVGELKEEFFVPSVKMIVKKHRMVRDTEGNLVDDIEHHEGWHCYLLNKSQLSSFMKKEWVIIEPAVVFNLTDSNVFLCDAEIRTKIDWDSTDPMLAELRTICAVAADGQIIPSAVADEVVYHLTRSLSCLTGRPHHFTPEYIFAQEVTAHYEELALYFFEFRRLMELGRIVVAVNILNSVKQCNLSAIQNIKKIISSIDDCLRDSSHYLKQSNHFFEIYREVSRKVYDQLLADFCSWRDVHQYSNIYKNVHANINNVYREAMPFYYDTHHRDVDKACEQVISQEISRLGSQFSSQIRNEVYRSRRTIADTLGEHKRAAIKPQLAAILPIQLSDWVYSQFFSGNLQPLCEALAKHQQAEFKKSLFSSLNDCASVAELDGGLAGSDASVSAIAKKITIRQLNEHIKEERKRLSEALASREGIATSIKTLGLGDNEADPDLEGDCTWVPANILHNHAGLFAQRSRLVYGGVSVQPRILQTNQVISNPASRIITPQQIGGGNQGGSGGRSGGGSGSGSGSGGTGTFNRKAITRDFQDHHIISDKNRNTKDHPLLAKAGFDLDHRANKIFLPKHPDLHPTRSVHNGKHLGDYSKYMKDKMDGILKTGQVQNWSQTEYNAALRAMLAVERQEHKFGNIKLNKHHRPWAT